MIAKKRLMVFWKVLIQMISNKMRKNRHAIILKSSKRQKTIKVKSTTQVIMTSIRRIIREHYLNRWTSNRSKGKKTIIV